MMIDRQSRGTSEVSMTDSSGQSAKCRFSYETDPSAVRSPAPAPVPEPTKPKPQFNFDSFIAKYNSAGMCLQSKIDYWTYEFCFGKQLKQYHDNDQYMLGGKTIRHESVQNAPGLIYDGGDMCMDLKPQPAPRQSRVKFMCRLEANRPQLVKVTEYSTCKYEVVIAASEVCDDERYERFQPSPSGVEEVAHTFEDWIVEMYETSERRLVCTARSSEYKASSGSGLNFVRFDFSVERNGLPTNKEKNQQIPGRVIAAQPGREPLKQEEFIATESSVKSSNQFLGKLAYLRIALA